LTIDNLFVGLRPEAPKLPNIDHCQFPEKSILRDFLDADQSADGSLRCLIAFKSLPWREGMSIPIKPIILIVALFTSLSAQAQGLLLGFESNITLKQDDIDLIHQTVDQKIHGKPVGTTASWSNPNTGNAGIIKLRKKFTKGNLHCEQVAYTLTTTTKAVEPEHYVLDSCLKSEGWKIA
jgi:surface antigen